MTYKITNNIGAKVAKNSVTNCEYTKMSKNMS